MAMPTKDSALVPWSTNFNTRGTATPLVFGLTAAQMTAYTPLHDAYVAAYMASSAEGARSKSLVTAKNVARDALLEYGRELYGLVQVNLSVSDANKDLIGVKVRGMPSPVPVPSVEPALDIMLVSGRTVRVRLHDNTGEGKRSKPPGVVGAAVCSYVGATAPTDPSEYKWEGSTTRSIFEITFPDTVAPGAVVWLTAMWFNNKQEKGPACDPVKANIQFGGMSMAA